MCICENKKYTIRISVDEWNDEQKKWDYFNDFDIYYCPICGKKINWKELKERSNT